MEGEKNGRMERGKDHLDRSGAAHLAGEAGALIIFIAKPHIVQI